MKKENQIWQFIADKLEQKQSVVLLLVAISSGSSPGRQGFKMAVTEDELCGSIGGGVMEVSLVNEARELFNKDKKGFVKTQVHQKNSPNSSGLICSGKQTVIFYKLTTDYVKMIRKISTYINNSRERYLCVTQDEISLLPKFKNHYPFNFERFGETDFVYEESLSFYKNKLSIIGGGHCALALSELMSKMDFHITLFDDRPDLNTFEKNEFVNEKHIIESYENITDHISRDANHYVVVMTLGYKFDEIVIRKLFDREFKYFGVLGSKAKMAVLLKDLEKDGFDKARLDKIYTPIGLKINSRSPEEIAVSIAAEIIAVKNLKS